MIQMSVEEFKEIINDCLNERIQSVKKEKEVSEFLTINEACEFLHLTKPTVQKLWNYP